jgi:hypothetical protein
MPMKPISMPMEGAGVRDGGSLLLRSAAGRTGTLKSRLFTLRPLERRRVNCRLSLERPVEQLLFGRNRLVPPVATLATALFQRPRPIMAEP